MYFKRMEMIGFKSFADRLEIDFDNGVTAIVGPNGCGKSNVGDAIRWVLGEQSSKALRGSSMQDVIFNGTERRKSLSYCEATLVFDNTDRYFDYVIVSPTRGADLETDFSYIMNFFREENPEVKFVSLGSMGIHGINKDNKIYSDMLDYYETFVSKFSISFYTFCIYFKCFGFISFFVRTFICNFLASFFDCKCFFDCSKIFSTVFTKINWFTMYL